MEQFMYFAIMKLSFDPNSTPSNQDKKALHSLCTKIKKRFDCLAIPYSSIQDKGISAIAISLLSSKKNNLNQKLDSIIDFCESEGFGRIAKEDTTMDHIDVLMDMVE